MTAVDEAPITVVDNPEQNRFEIHVGDTVAGFTEYRPRGDRYAFVHTEIGDDFGGRGLASRLIKDTLDEMRSRGTAVATGTRAALPGTLLHDPADDSLPSVSTTARS